MESQSQTWNRVAHYVQIMLNRIHSQEKQEQTLDKHKQIVLDTIMKKFLVFF